MERNLQLAWAAGFIDGEACITAQRWTRKTGLSYYQVLIDVSQARRAPMDRLVELFGGYVRIGRASKASGRTSDYYFWRLYGPKAAVVIQAILPYLVAKRQQAEIVLRIQRTIVGPQGTVTDLVHTERAELYALLRVLNARNLRHAERLNPETPQAAPLRMVR